uniref:Solute carrier family 25 member 27 n=1 Tax=Cyprinus carpio TaxID=7962 RepID=A0A8C2I306_CYPCA
IQSGKMITLLTFVVVSWRRSADYRLIEMRKHYHRWLCLTKTRLQIQGEGSSRQHGGSVPPPKYRGLLSKAMGIVIEKGPLKLWQGVTPAIYRHIGRMLIAMILGRSEDGICPVWKAVIGSVISGALGQFIASPTDLVKVQMHSLKGIVHPKIKNSEGGIRGLWAGRVPSVQRAALVSLGDFITCDTVKHFVLRNTSIPDNSICPGLPSICSGLVAAIMGTPADVVKTRVMNQPRDSNGRGLLYKSSTDCLVQSVRKEGFFSLYKGFLPTWFRMI